MKFNHVCLLAMLFTGPAVYAMPVSGALSPALAATDPIDGGTTFTVADSLEVPGKKLSAGTYTIRMVDHLSDRMIVRVERNGKAQTTFLALPKSSLARSGQGPILLNNGAKSAMRGFVFPDGTVAEFVYPKAEAVGLAKANNTTIPAVDPASEGRPDVSKLSPEDMQMVTLWMLTPTPVGPGAGGAGITAAKYQMPAGSAAASVASAGDGAGASGAGTSGAGASVARASVPSRPRVRPAMAALPHTAGEMPLVLVGGLLSLGAAGLLRRRRVL